MKALKELTITRKSKKVVTFDYVFSDSIVLFASSKPKTKTFSLDYDFNGDLKEMLSDLSNYYISDKDGVRNYATNDTKINLNGFNFYESHPHPNR